VSACPYCGDALTDPRRVWCGKPSCKDARNAERLRQFRRRVKDETGRAYQPPCRADGGRADAAIYEHVCPWCGKTFKNHKNKDACHCSVKCYMASRTERRRQKLLPIIHPAPAPFSLLPESHPAMLMQRPEYKRRFVAGTCRRCGEPFVAWSEAGIAVYCSPSCAHSTMKDKRRAQKRGARHVAYRRVAIFERDGWRCHICDRKVRRKAHWSHPLSPTIDHLVPLSKGGSDSPENVACAHRECNTKRNAHGPAQLILLG